MNEIKTVKDFISKFYDISCSIDAGNYTLDEFYDEFPKETHEILLKIISEKDNGGKI